MTIRALPRVGRTMRRDLHKRGVRNLNGDNSWSGYAFNPEDGKTYRGEIKLSGNHMTTSGCALAGLICKSAGWTRAK